MKKKGFTTIIMLFMVLLFTGCGEKAILKYQVLDNGEYMVVGVDNKEATSAVVPEEFNGIRVTQIGLGAFANCEKLKTVELPATIEFIGLGAFQNCTSLRRISLPPGLQEIAPAAFAYCTSLETVDFNDELKTIRMYAFLECASLKKIELPESLEILEKKAFYGCSSAKKLEFLGELEVLEESVFENCTALKKIGFPKGLEEIGDRTFYGCSSLGELVLPEGIRTLSENTFQNCTELAKLEIPASLQYIGYNSFAGCHNLKDIKVSDNNVYYTSKDLEGNEVDAIMRWWKNKRGNDRGTLYVTNRNLTIPEGIISVYSSVYEGMNLKSIKVPSTISVETLDDIFKKNSELTTIYGVAGSDAEKWAEERGRTFVEE